MKDRACRVIDFFTDHADVIEAMEAELKLPDQVVKSIAALTKNLKTHAELMRLKQGGPVIDLPSAKDLADQTGLKLNTVRKILRRGSKRRRLRPVLPISVHPTGKRLYQRDALTNQSIDDSKHDEAIGDGHKQPVQRRRPKAHHPSNN